MRRERFSIMVTLMLFAMNVATSQGNHLEPVNGIFSVYDFQFEYYSKVRKVLLKDLSDNPVIRFLVIPSFAPEHVIDIEYDADSKKYYLVYHICENSLWLNEKWSEVKVERSRKEVGRSLSDLVKALFKTAILRTRYSENETMGLDGANYYFTVSDYGPRTGTVWSPSEGTRMKRLVDVGYSLIKLAENKKPQVDLDNKLRAEIEKLTNELR